SASVVYRLCLTGKLCHFRFGEGRGAIRLERTDLQEFIERCKVEKRSDESDAEKKPAGVRPLQHLVLEHLKLTESPPHPCGAPTRAGTPCALLTKDKHCHLHGKKKPAG